MQASRLFFFFLCVVLSQRSTPVVVECGENIKKEYVYFRDNYKCKEIHRVPVFVGLTRNELTLSSVALVITLTLIIYVFRSKQAP